LINNIRYYYVVVLYRIIILERREKERIGERGGFSQRQAGERRGASTTHLGKQQPTREGVTERSTTAHNKYRHADRPAIGHR
jgi:hypothetical protein